MKDLRTCGHRFFLSRTCADCLREATRRRMAHITAERRQAAEQQRPEQGGPSLRELREQNQTRIARERLEE